MPMTLDDYRDLAHEMVTLLLNRDRAGAAEAAERAEEPVALALVLADLATYIHRRWIVATGMTDADAIEAWQEMLLDVATWVEGRRDQA